MSQPIRIDAGKRISVIIPAYRDSARATVLVHKLREQRLPAGWSQEIIVVDDGSGAPHGERLASLADQATIVICLPENVGRSSAMATGIDRASGEMLMVTNSDCLPADTLLLAAHIRAMADSNFVASTGPVRGHDDGFWSRYQNDVMTRRARRRDFMPGTVGATANACMRRQAYLEVGGLDRSFTGYGFEDRDLLLRLAEMGRVAWTPDAVIEHMDELSLSSICRKVRESGHGNSGLFSQRHPAAYRLLGYARFDARGRPLISRLGRTIDPIIPRMAALLDPHLERLPFPLARFLVKAVSAVAFLAGTSRAANSGG